MLISIPTFEEIYKVAGFKEDEKYKASYEYTSILGDSQTKPDEFSSIFVQVRKLCANERKIQESQFGSMQIDCVMNYIKAISFWKHYTIVCIYVF